MRAESARAVSPETIHADIVAASGKGRARDAACFQFKRANRFCSSRRASKMPTAGIIGRMERALTVQFTWKAKMTVPATHSARNIESEFRRFQVS